jgi:hypothetical protein
MQYLERKEGDKNSKVVNVGDVPDDKVADFKTNVAEYMGREVDESFENDLEGASGMVTVYYDDKGDIDRVELGTTGGRRRSRLNKKTRRAKGRRRHTIRRKLRGLTSRRR